jgi:hypothetical protein
MPLVAPAGGATAGTIIYDSTSLVVVLPMTTATSGSTYTGKVIGRVNSVAKVSGTAWVGGAALTWVSSSSAFQITVSGSGQTTQAVAFGAASSAAVTGDVVLRHPVISG